MYNLRRIDVLLNEDTGERFNDGDIIKIITVGTYGHEYIGRIDNIDILELTLDTSKEYKNNTHKIKYEDISIIEKINK